MVADFSAPSVFLRQLYYLHLSFCHIWLELNDCPPQAPVLSYYLPQGFSSMHWTSINFFVWEEAGWCSKKSMDIGPRDTQALILALAFASWNILYILTFLTFSFITLTLKSC